MKLRYTSRAKDELETALAWYERQKQGLGHEFLDCVEVATQSILENPKMYRLYYFFFHGCVVRRFPFVIFYTIEENMIVQQLLLDVDRKEAKELRKEALDQLKIEAKAIYTELMRKYQSDLPLFKALVKGEKILLSVNKVKT